MVRAATWQERLVDGVGNRNDYLRENRAHARARRLWRWQTVAPGPVQLPPLGGHREHFVNGGVSLFIYWRRLLPHSAKLLISYLLARPPALHPHREASTQHTQHVPVRRLRLWRRLLLQRQTLKELLRWCRVRR